MLLRSIRPAVIAATLVTALVGTMLVGQSVTAEATSDTILDVLVSDDPVDWTPQLTGTRVVAIDTTPTVVAAGGLFTGARRPGGSDVTVGNFLLFENGTGALLPSPSFDREVLAVEVAADGQSFYVAGKFKTADGLSRKGLARVALDGTVIRSWAPKVDWVVNDIALVGDRLFVGGNFNLVNGEAREGLAALDAETGELLDWAPVVADPRSTDRTVGHRSIDKLDATPDGTRLVVIGNFQTVDGVARHQVAMFDIAGPTITLADWYAQGFNVQCRALKWPMWIRDMDISPTGDYVVFGTTGAYGSPTGSQALCDTVTRFELWQSGTVTPTWRSYSGGDTFYGVSASGPVVYAGGHHRWMNNPYRGDREGAGAVDRYGITALDARTGVPLDWDPRRDPRGYGTYELIGSDEGLWVGQDTGYIGGEFHSLIAMLPAATGRAVPRPAAGAAGDGVLLIDGSAVTPLAAVAGGGPLGETVDLSFDPTGVVGATMVGNDLMVARSDASLLLVGDGGTGAVSVVDTNGLITDGYFQVGFLTSLFYDEQSSMLFYTRSGSSTLRGRAYSPDSGIVEALEHTISTSGDGFTWSDVSGAYIHDGTLYVGRGDGTLDAIDWRAARPVVGSMATVGGPSIDGVDYAVDAMTGLGTTASAANVAPVAAIEVECVDLTCWIDAGDAHDVDGYIADAVVTANGAVVATSTGGVVTLPTEGTYEFVLTITDDAGATAQATTSAVTHADPTPVIAVDCTDLTCTFDASASTDGATPGAGIVGWSWDLGDGTSASTEQVEHTYAGDTDTTVTLTVTDDEGVSASTTVPVSVVAPLDGVTFLGAASDNRWTTTPTVTVPGEVRDGTVALLEVTANAPGDITGAPTGAGTWVELQRVVAQGMETVVWQGLLDAGDAGSSISVTLGQGRKSDISLLLYGGVDTAAPVVASAAAAETTATAVHVTPSVVTTEPALVVSIWADKTGTSTSWLAPAGELVRAASFGAGGGRIGALVTDLGAPAPAGTVGGLAATSGESAVSATMLTIALRPA